ncbi:hypothetical protein [Geothrix sp. SG200]|uniref:hypothetical protein n=1 Tax=Geothrix sp. SG200 TaxID=2922865 RepID=UPI001FAD5656|nr:hypothetical protein [Geothrix sp. SG200]
MRVRIQDLPADRAASLQSVLGAGGVDGAFSQKRPRRWLLAMGLLSLAAGLGSAWGLVSGFSEWPRPADAWAARVALLGLAYGPLALVEVLRGRTGGWRPCLLLTPYDLVQCTGGHRPLDIHRLSLARAFQRVEEYHGSTWTGLGYRFDFDGGEQVRFSLRRPEDIAAADRVLALARSAGQGEITPELPRLGRRSLTEGLPPAPAPGFAGKLLDPASEIWLRVLGVLLIAFIPYAIFR